MTISGFALIEANSNTTIVSINPNITPLGVLEYFNSNTTIVSINLTRF